MIAHRLIRLWLIGFALLVGLAAGCASSTHEPVHLIASTTFFEPDIPLPAGFWKVDQASEDSASGQQRLYLRHTYEGRSEPYLINSFYLEQMPIFRWARTNAGSVNGVYTQRYVKANEACTMEIRPGYWGKAQVRVIVTQEQRGEPPPGSPQRGKSS